MKRGFTLVELLVVVAIIVTLLAILVPAFDRAFQAVDRAVCATNEKAWGTGLAFYANDNTRLFPYNGKVIPGYSTREGYHLSWNSDIVELKFWNVYLTPITDAAKTEKNDIYSCPTQKWHQINDPTLSGGLVGYLYLPHRSLDTSAPSTYNPPENPNGNDWVTRDRLGQVPRAPVLADMVQSGGSSGPDQWFYGDGRPFSSHVTTKSGNPDGSNMLFEDSSVIWYERSKIGMGALISGAWRWYYKIAGVD